MIYPSSLSTKPSPPSVVTSTSIIKKQDELRIRPATMAGLPRIELNPLGLGLPEEIFGLEILVRLPPKDLVRCRAVCRAWRRLATNRDFLLAHHRHQPSLPLVVLCKQNCTWGDLRAFHHQAAAAGDIRLQPVARIDDDTATSVEASCDGLLLLSVCTFSPYIQRDFICNLTTRQIGQVPEIHDFRVTGLYRHPPTGEYRLLLHMSSIEMFGKNDPCYVFSLGCNQLRPRCIGCPPELACFYDAPVLVNGNLHWSWWPGFVNKDQSKKTITVFDTTAELFRLMRGPVVQTSTAHLYEVDGTLGIYSCNDTITTVDIWLMKDYDSEVWSHKYHVKLPVAKIREFEARDVILVHEERDVFVAYNFERMLFLVNTEGRLLASLQLDASIILGPTHRIKQSLVQHSFFSALQGAPLNAWSFI